MADDKTPKPAEERSSFPYHALWAGYGNVNVTLWDLEQNEDEYRSFNEVSKLPGVDVPNIEQENVETVIGNHGFDVSYAKPLWLVCCFYLLPKQASKFGVDPSSSRKALIRAANAARNFDNALSYLSPKVLAALYFKRPFIPRISRPDGQPFHLLDAEVRDFSLVAYDAVDDLAAVEGRPRYHERDTMFRLFIEILNDGGFGDLRISNGTKLRPEPHLAGKAGKLLWDLIKLVEPHWDESSIAPRIKKVRLKMNSMRAGAKTRPT